MYHINNEHKEYIVVRDKKDAADSGAKHAVDSDAVLFISGKVTIHQPGDIVQFPTTSGPDSVAGRSDETPSNRSEAEVSGDEGTEVERGGQPTKSHKQLRPPLRPLNSAPAASSASAEQAREPPSRAGQRRADPPGPSRYRAEILSAPYEPISYTPLSVSGVMPDLVQSEEDRRAGFGRETLTPEVSGEMPSAPRRSARLAESARSKTATSLYTFGSTRTVRPRATAKKPISGVPHPSSFKTPALVRQEDDEGAKPGLESAALDMSSEMSPPRQLAVPGPKGRPRHARTTSAPVLAPFRLARDVPVESISSAPTPVVGETPLFGGHEETQGAELGAETPTPQMLGETLTSPRRLLDVGQGARSRAATLNGPARIRRQDAPSTGPAHRVPLHNFRAVLERHEENGESDHQLESPTLEIARNMPPPPPHPLAGVGQSARSRSAATIGPARVGRPGPTPTERVPKAPLPGSRATPDLERHKENEGAEHESGSPILGMPRPAGLGQGAQSRTPAIVSALASATRQITSELLPIHGATPAGPIAGVPPPASGATSAERIPGEPFLAYGAMPVLPQREGDEVAELRRQPVVLDMPSAATEMDALSVRMMKLSAEAKPSMASEGTAVSKLPAVGASGGGSSTGGQSFGSSGGTPSFGGVQGSVSYNTTTNLYGHPFGGQHPWAGAFAPGHDPSFQHRPQPPVLHSGGPADPSYGFYYGPPLPPAVAGGYPAYASHGFPYGLPPPPPAVSGGHPTYSGQGFHYGFPPPVIGGGGYQAYPGHGFPHQAPALPTDNHAAVATTPSAPHPGAGASSGHHTGRPTQQP